MGFTKQISKFLFGELETAGVETLGANRHADGGRDEAKVCEPTTTPCDCDDCKKGIGTKTDLRRAEPFRMSA